MRWTPWIRPDQTINELTLPTAPVDMNDQEVRNHVLHTVADTTERDALVAVKGKVAFKNDSSEVFICTEV